MFVGKGANYNLVSDIVNQSGFSDKVIFAGLIPQLETPEYLAASDILVSPQIPNPDGTPFFGSPTKLFEYMAMGKAIVASSLDQMSYLLSNNETALLTEPASVTDLTSAILKLSKDKFQPFDSSEVTSDISSLSEYLTLIILPSSSFS